MEQEIKRLCEMVGEETVFKFENSIERDSSLRSE
jgi:hypothetical protein